MALDMEVGLSPGTLCSMGTQLTLPKKGRSPQFSAHVYVRKDSAPLRKKGAEPPPQFAAHFYCGQTAGCMKLPLGLEVGISPGDVRWGPSYPQKKGTPTPPNFWPMSIVATVAHLSYC